MLSSRARRERRRSSQFLERGRGCCEDGSAREDEGKELLVVGGVESSSGGRASPNMTERRASSIPIKSRITRRVMRSQKDSLSSAIVSRTGLPGGWAFCGSIGPSLPATSWLAVCVAPCLPSLARLAFLLLVSFSTSSSSTFDCSSLHSSILSIRVFSKLCPSSSPKLSSVLCTLDLRLR